MQWNILLCISAALYYMYTTLLAYASYATSQSGIHHLHHFHICVIESPLLYKCLEMWTCPHDIQIISLFHSQSRC